MLSRCVLSSRDKGVSMMIGSLSSLVCANPQSSDTREHLLSPADGADFRISCPLRSVIFTS